jgi:UDP-N-acetylglucosamine transferase subunit ALG13
VIFGTVGTHSEGFDRLVVALDEYAQVSTERVVIQVGTSQHEPQYAEWFRFDAPSRIETLMDQARVVVSHAGAGSLLTALERGRRILAIPRVAALGEAVDDHQRELCEALANAGHIQWATNSSSIQAFLMSDQFHPERPSLAVRASLIEGVSHAIRSLSPDRVDEGAQR